LHGVPANLDLSVFQGARLDRIDLGAFIIHFRFSDPTAEIAVEGSWALLAPDGSLVDQQMEPAQRDSYRLHVLLGHEVIRSEVDAPKSFTLHFNSGHALRIADDSRQYESFSIQPGDIYI
jgi:hypothetical protein